MKLFLITEKFIYIRISIFIWRFDGLTRIKNIDKSSSDQLLITQKELNDQGNTLPIVIDLKGISGAIDRSLTSYFEYIVNEEIEIHFINYTQVKLLLRNSIDEWNGSNQVSISEIDGQFIIAKEQSKTQISFQEISDLTNKSLYQYVKKIVNECFVPNNKSKDIFIPLKSTPILANGLFDASTILASPDYFSWTALALADKVEELITSNSITNAVLLAVSVYSNPFAKIISILLDVDLDSIEYFSIEKTTTSFKKHFKRINSDSNYIFIADFIFGGTEIKLSKQYVNHCDSQLKHAVSIGKLFKEDDRMENFQIESIVLLREANEKSKYKLFNE